MNPTENLLQRDILIISLPFVRFTDRPEGAPTPDAEDLTAHRCTQRVNPLEQYTGALGVRNALLIQTHLTVSSRASAPVLSPVKSAAMGKSPAQRPSRNLLRLYQTTNE